MTTAVQQNPQAQAVLTPFLAQYGLQSLANWALARYVQLGGGQGALDALSFEITERPEFQARFPAIALMQKAGYQPVTPQQYLDYERTVSQALRSAGALPAFYSRNSNVFNQMVTGLLTNNVSAAEATQRVADASNEALNAPASVRQAWGTLYGVHGDAAMTSYYMDPDFTLPHLEQMQRTAFAVGVGADQGLHLSTDTAGQIGQLGLTDDSMRQHLVDISRLGALNARVGEGQLTQDQVAAGAFGLNAQSQAELERVTQARVGSAAGLTGTAFRPSTDAGVPGVGVAPT